jgi:hypothetical protein
LTSLLALEQLEQLNSLREQGLMKPKSLPLMELVELQSLKDRFLS